MYIMLLICLFTHGISEAANLSVASYYGDHMVLQRGPAWSNIWGYSDNIGAVVTVQLHDTKLQQTTYTIVTIGPEGKGVWRVMLKPEAAGGPYFITITDKVSNSIKISDVMFGDVWVCSGQSNMQFTLPSAFNATEEINAAHLFPDVRLFTVAEKTSDKPLYDFIAVQEKWSVASAASVGNGNWTYFSAVCWLYGRNLNKELGIPIGLIASDWGGTAVEVWSSPDALKQCGITEPPKYRKSLDDVPPAHFDEYRYKENSTVKVPTAHSVLWNAMMHPLLNCTIYGAIWYQGEANAYAPSDRIYNCTFPAMIDDWREKFNSGSNNQTSNTFPFGFVQLAGFRDNTSITTGFPDLRWSQTASYGYVPNRRMRNVFMAVAMDLPDFKSPFGSVHPRDKQTVASRLALSGLAVAYGLQKYYQGPFPSNIMYDQSNEIVITYDQGHTELVFKSNVGFEVCCTASRDPAECDQPSVSKWFPLANTGSSHGVVTLSIPGACYNLNINYIRYAWRESPCQYKKCMVYSKINDLPAPPFKKALK